MHVLPEQCLNGRCVHRGTYALPVEDVEPFHTDRGDSDDDLRWRNSPCPLSARQASAPDDLIDLDDTAVASNDDELTNSFPFLMLPTENPSASRKRRADGIGFISDSQANACT
jgi:hypothetical protein